MRTILECKALVLAAMTAEEKAHADCLAAYDRGDAETEQAARIAKDRAGAELHDAMLLYIETNERLQGRELFPREASDAA